MKTQLFWHQQAADGFNLNSNCEAEGQNQIDKGQQWSPICLLYIGMAAFQSFMERFYRVTFQNPQNEG